MTGGHVSFERKHGHALPELARNRDRDIKKLCRPGIFWLEESIDQKDFQHGTIGTRMNYHGKICLCLV